MVGRRVAGEPMAYVVGHKAFWEDDFVVEAGAVLIPRPDSESMVEAALQVARKRQEAFRAAPSHSASAMHVLELGVGSGAVLLSVVKGIPESIGVGVDVSKDALRVCRRNIERLGLEKSITLMEGSWLEGDALLERLGRRRFDLVLCNPPYISTDELMTLSVGVRDHEPMLALDGGQDGLRHYRAVVPLLSSLLQRTPRHGANGNGVVEEAGHAFLEIGWQQEEDVRQLVADRSDIAYVQTHHDMGHRPRCIEVVST